MNALYSEGAETPFVDVFKMASPWKIVRYGKAGLAPAPSLTQDGWIAFLDQDEVAQVSIFSEADRYPSGVYALTYEGDGELRVTGVGASARESGPRRISVTVEPFPIAHGGIVISESSTDSANPIRNIKLLLPGAAADSPDRPFNPAFLKLLAPFKVIRFVGWAHPNRSDTSDWRRDERPASYATQASPRGWGSQSMSGVALEYQVQLANTLGADPWFIVPLKADDDFIREMARLVHRKLKRDLNLYVQLSNEVWNSYFPEAGYASRMGVVEGLDQDPKAAAVDWYSKRSVEMFDIWNDEFGPERKRIVHIIEGAELIPEFGERALSYHDAYRKTDALAVAAYFDSIRVRDYSHFDIADMTPDQVLDGVEGEVRGRMRTVIGNHAAIAKKYSVGLVAYEGGLMLNSDRAPPEQRDKIAALYRSAARDPRMAQIYRQLLDEWSAAGGGLFNHFVDCDINKYSNFGLLDFQDQDSDTSPIYRMLKLYNQMNASRSEGDAGPP